MREAAPRYRFLPPDEVAALSPKDAVAYAAERQRFDAEVAQHRERLERDGVMPGLKGGAYHARCGRLIGHGPCLARRSHKGAHSPVWTD